MPICLDTIVHEQHWVQIHIQMTWTFGTPKNNVISKATSQKSNNYTNRTISSFSDWKDEFLFGRELTMIFTPGFSRYFSTFLVKNVWSTQTCNFSLLRKNVLHFRHDKLCVHWPKWLKT